MAGETERVWGAGSVAENDADEWWAGNGSWFSVTVIYSVDLCLNDIIGTRGKEFNYIDTVYRIMIVKI